MMMFPWLEQLLGKAIFPHGLGTLVLPLVFGFIGWVMADLILRSQKLLKQRKKIFSSKAKLYLATVIVWETFVLSYLLISQSAVNHHNLSLSTMILLIAFPPIIMVVIYLIILGLKKFRYFDNERFNEMLAYVKENLNTFPVFLQIMSAFFLMSSLIFLPLNYLHFVHLFIFVSALISMSEAYKNDEFHFSTLFIVIACVYNPIYPIYLSKNSWIILNSIVALLFMYKVSAIWITEQHLEKNLERVAKKIDSVLKDFDKNTQDYTSEMLEKYIKNKHSYALSVRGNTFTWKEKFLPHFTFSTMEVFNGEIAICVSGKEAFNGFHVLLIFYNQALKYMIYLDLNATITAKRLKKVMVRDLGYFEYLRQLPKQ